MTSFRQVASDGAGAAVFLGVTGDVGLGTFFEQTSLSLASGRPEGSYNVGEWNHLACSGRRQGYRPATALGNSPDTARDSAGQPPTLFLIVTSARNGALEKDRGLRQPNGERISHVGYRHPGADSHSTGMGYSNGRRATSDSQGLIGTANRRRLRSASPASRNPLRPPVTPTHHP